MNAQTIIQFIKNATKTTPLTVYINGDFPNLLIPNVQVFGTDSSHILIGDQADILPFLEEHETKITGIHIESDRRNSAIPLLDTRFTNARIEPGAIIRDQVEIGDNAVIMMNATINIGAVIGSGTMIDMNTVLGGRATVGKTCHIGAGAVLAGVIEPPSATPVIVEDDVVIGANAVVLEGVRVGQGSVVAAGAIVIEDVPPFTVVAGMPARVIKKIDQKTKDKTKIEYDLRFLDN